MHVSYDWVCFFAAFLFFFFVSPHCDKCLGLSSCLLLAEICPRPSGSAWLQALLQLGGVVVRRASHGRRGAGELCRLRLRPSVTHRPAGMRVCHRWEWPFFFPPPLAHTLSMLWGGTKGYFLGEQRDDKNLQYWICQMSIFHFHVVLLCNSNTVLGYDYYLESRCFRVCKLFGEKKRSPKSCRISNRFWLLSVQTDGSACLGPRFNLTFTNHHQYFRTRNGAWLAFDMLGNLLICVIVMNIPIRSASDWRTWPLRGNTNGICKVR